MAGLADKVEEIILPANQSPHLPLVTRIRQLDRHSVLVILGVEQSPAVLRHEIVDQQHVRAELHETSCRVGADEAEPAGDEEPAAVEMVMSGHPGPRRKRRESL
jgi:hypothetical protein